MKTETNRICQTLYKKTLKSNNSIFGYWIDKINNALLCIWNICNHWRTAHLYKHIGEKITSRQRQTAFSKAVSNLSVFVHLVFICCEKHIFGKLFGTFWMEHLCLFCVILPSTFHCEIHFSYAYISYSVHIRCMTWRNLLRCMKFNMEQTSLLTKCLFNPLTCFDFLFLLVAAPPVIEILRIHKHNRKWISIPRAFGNVKQKDLLGCAHWIRWIDYSYERRSKITVCDFGIWIFWHQTLTTHIMHSHIDRKPQFKAELFKLGYFLHFLPFQQKSRFSRQQVSTFFFFFLLFLSSRNVKWTLQWG